MSAVRARYEEQPVVALLQGHGRDGEPMSQTLAACGRLAGASAAALLVVDEAAAVVRTVQADDGAPVLVDPQALRAAARLESALMFPSADPRWIAGEGADATLVVRAGASGPLSYLLALAFAEAPSVTRARVARLTPDLVQLVAAQIALEDRLAEVEEQRVAYAAALDDGDCGVIAVRDDHSVLFANTAASAMLAEGDGLQVKRGVIRPADFRQAVRFEAALDAVQAGAGGDRTGKPAGLVVLLPGRESARPFISVIVPARPQSASTRGASALVYLFKPEVGSARGVEVIAELHKLSRVESRLLAQLCAGLTLAESAERMRIKVETARAYLKQIFAKTGTHRQAELVTLMTRYLRAMRGDFNFQSA